MVDDEEMLRRTIAARVTSLASTSAERAALSKRSKIPASTLDRIMRGANNPTASNLLRIADAAGVSLDWLAGRGDHAEPQTTSGEATRLETISDPPVAKANPEELSEGFVIVPRLRLEASAGAGRVAVTSEVFRGDVVAFREDWLRGIGVSATRAELLTAVGDSMEPTIRDGDLLLVDRSVDRVVSNGIYVLVYEGAILVKRIVLRLDGSLILKSDNDRYGEEAVPKAVATELIIEGRVRWHGRLI